MIKMACRYFSNGPIVMSGIFSRRIAETPIAVVDIETTGLHPSGDRVVEVAIVRIDPGSGDLQLVLDTLVNPKRRMAATEIHGITESDILDAPTFEEIAPEVAQALSGAVLAAYNVYFDAKFVRAELERSEIRPLPPHLCLMYMRPLLGVGTRCSLADACMEHGIPHDNQHVAAADALASAKLWLSYLDTMKDLQIQTFGDLAARKPYKFMHSFSAAPVVFANLHSTRGKTKPRGYGLTSISTTTPEQLDAARALRSEYWDALKAALADLDITPNEIEYLGRKRRALGLTPAEVRALHARAFTGLLADVSDDHEITDDEVLRVSTLATALRKLGWAPGDPVWFAPQPPEERQGLMSRLFGN